MHSRCACSLPVALLALLAMMALVAGTMPVVAEPSLDKCLGLETPPERLACLETGLAASALLDQLALVTPLLETHPDTLSELLERMRMSRDAEFEADPGLEAARLDLLGQALTLQGRLPAAADALAAALALDDGTLRVEWRAPGGGSTWSRALDLGNGRIQRGATALLAAGRIEAARPLLEQATALGAGEWAREAWSGQAGAFGDGTPPEVLGGWMWRESLPDLEVQLFGGQKQRLHDSLGSVLLLDFWASWCEPCVRELPFVDQLYRSRTERGLQVLAINYHEEPQEAIAFAQAMGLSIPVGAADREIERAFNITSMPTVIVADQWGRLRGRWEGYEDNVESELTGLVDHLLSSSEEERIELGQVLQGAGSLAVDWVRVARRDIESVRIVRADTGLRVAVAHDRALTLFDSQGLEERVLTRPVAASRLRAADLDGDAVDELIGFRPGGSQVFVFDLVAKTFIRWDSPHPVFDVDSALLGDEQRPVVVLGTLDGLWRAEPDGTAMTRVGELGAVSGVRRAEAPGKRLTVLESGGARLHWLDHNLAVAESVPVPPDAWTLVSDPAIVGAGVAPVAVIDSAVGSFLPGGGRQLALALTSGHLVLVDVATGEPRYRLALTGSISGLAAGDLDGDGSDELVLIQGRNLALLRATGAER